MNNKPTIRPFVIETLDSNAQGVSKIDGEIIFIPKTLPGESGECEIVAKKGKVSFAKVVKLQSKSELRQNAKCSHYEICGGCDYLHTSYQHEIEFKKNSLIDIFKRQHKLEIPHKMYIHKADTREKYRNRVQLHYHKPSSTIGYISNQKKVFQLDHCMLAEDEIEAKIKELLFKENWKNLIKRGPSKGHIEVYNTPDGVIKTSTNQRYSSGGFSQVNHEMNEKLHLLLDDFFDNHNFQVVFDLFGGAGNITRNCQAEKIHVIDGSPSKIIKLKNPNQKYFQIDLYSKEAIAQLRNLESATSNCLVLDPPRSGFKEIAIVAERFSPEKILYVSCNPQTLARDLKALGDDYSLDELHLFDFFPSTKHYETVAILSKA